MSATVLPTPQTAPQTTPEDPQAPRSRRPFRLPKLGYSYPVVGVLMAAGIGGFAYVYQVVAKGMGITATQVRFDPEPLTRAGWVIETHAAGAVASFLLGLVILFLPKGTKMHRQLGWGWVVAMGTAAATSFFIRENGQFTWIHSFTALTAVMLPMAVAAARMHYAKIHARFMTALFLGGAFTAGLFTFLPGRLLWQTFFAAA